jgi:hypothetical protein
MIDLGPLRLKIRLCSNDSPEFDVISELFEGISSLSSGPTPRDMV